MRRRTPPALLVQPRWAGGEGKKLGWKLYVVLDRMTSTKQCINVQHDLCFFNSQS